MNMTEKVDKSQQETTSIFAKIAKADFIGPLMALIILCVVLSITTPNFLDLTNFRNISLQVSILSIVAIGSTIVILAGGIDLSPGSMVAFLTMSLAAMVKLQGVSLWISIPLVLVFGAGLGAFNGFLVAYVRIPAFIVTLAALSGFKGLALTIGDGTPVFSLSPQLGQVFYGKLFGLPLPFVYVVVLYVIFIIVMNYTKPGREIYAVGGNDSAANLSGINVKVVRFMSFVIAGICTAIGAVLLSARLNSGSPNYGTGLELQAIAAAIVGGTSLSGGRGRIISTLLGALIIVVVQNGLNLNAVSTSMQSLTIGSIILIAVGLDIWGKTIREIISKSKVR